MKTPHNYTPASFPLIGTPREREFAQAEYQPETRAFVWERLMDAVGNLDAYRSDWYWNISWATEGDRLHKRISRHFYREYGIKVPDDTLAAIAEHAGSRRGFTFRYDVTDEFDWNRGEFADDGSCYWTNYNHARTRILPKLGAVALRSFGDDGKGNGRCWIVPVPPFLRRGCPGDAFVCFNYYGACDQEDRVCAVICDTLSTEYGGEWVSKPVDGLVIDQCYINQTTPYIFTTAQGATKRTTHPPIRLHHDLVYYSQRAMPAWCGEALAMESDDHDF